MAGGNGTRSVAIVGPYLSGKTSLMESLLSVSGAIHRKGSVKDGNTVGDSAPEARARHMSIEVSVGSTSYLGRQLGLSRLPRLDRDAPGGDQRADGL